MCGGPSAPTPPPKAAEAPRLPDPSTALGATDSDKRRKALAGGESSRSTILTGSRGVQDGAATAQKTLLGQ